MFESKQNLGLIPKDILQTPPPNGLENSESMEQKITKSVKWSD
jgi:hypothetical protein